MLPSRPSSNRPATTDGTVRQRVRADVHVGRTRPFTKTAADSASCAHVAHGPMCTLMQLIVWVVSAT